MFGIGVHGRIEDALTFAIFTKLATKNGHQHFSHVSKFICLSDQRIVNIYYKSFWYDELHVFLGFRVISYWYGF